MNYKYEHLLSTCECGKKFHSHLTWDEDETKCVECRKERHINECNLCGAKASFVYGLTCPVCRRLEIRGMHGCTGKIAGYPSGEDEGTCTGCGDMLHSTSGSDCVCYGCSIEPLNSTPKPAKR